MEGPWIFIGFISYPLIYKCCKPRVFAASCSIGSKISKMPSVSCTSVMSRGREKSPRPLWIQLWPRARELPYPCCRTARVYCWPCRVKANCFCWASGTRMKGKAPVRSRVAGWAPGNVWICSSNETTSDTAAAVEGPTSLSLRGPTVVSPRPTVFCVSRIEWDEVGITSPPPLHPSSLRWRHWPLQSNQSCWLVCCLPQERLFQWFPLGLSPHHSPYSTARELMWGLCQLLRIYLPALPSGEPDVDRPELQRPRPPDLQGTTWMGVPQGGLGLLEWVWVQSHCLGAPGHSHYSSPPAHTHLPAAAGPRGRLGEGGTASASRAVLGLSPRGPGLPFLQGPGSENWLSLGPHWVAVTLCLYDSGRRCFTRARTSSLSR